MKLSNIIFNFYAMDALNFLPKAFLWMYELKQQNLKLLEEKLLYKY